MPPEYGILVDKLRELFTAASRAAMNQELELLDRLQWAYGVVIDCILMYLDDDDYWPERCERDAT